jgi:hypothetical protein
MIDIHQKFFSCRFFTGTTKITDLEKTNWLHSADNMGSKMIRVKDNNILQEALKFAYDAYNIALSWILDNKR